MSAADIVAHRYKPGQSGNPAGLTRERRALYAAIEGGEIPKVLALLNQLYEQAMSGDVSAGKLWLDQVRGPVKAREQEEVERLVEQRIIELIADAKLRNIP